MDDELKAAIILFTIADVERQKASAAASAAQDAVRKTGGEYNLAKKHLDSVIQKIGQEILKHGTGTDLQPD
jgi:hypothetical protein